MSILVRRSRKWFVVTAGSVNLATRMQSDFTAAGLYAWRRNNRDDRVLRQREDGALAITSKRHYSSYFLGFIGGTTRDESWTIHWPALSPP